MSWKVFNFFAKLLRIRGNLDFVIHYGDGRVEHHLVEFPMFK